MTELSLQETFKQKISDNLRESFMSMLPEEILSGLIDQALDEFINGPLVKRFETKSEWINGCYQIVTTQVPNSKYCAYNDSETLKGMIWQEIQKIGKDLINKEFAKPEWQQKWDANSGVSEQVVPIVEEIIKGNAEVFMAGLIRNIISGAMLSTISTIRNNNTTMNVPYQGF